MTDTHYTYSALRERIAEHIFVGDAIRTLWWLGILDVEVLRSEFDAQGYDLVMARRPVVRHIQFKTRIAIWIRLDQDLNMGPYFWFGGAPGQPLPVIDGYGAPR
ncbi:MAG: hypothetical protein ACK4Y4_13265 [Brevundimonas sp.]